MQCVIKTQYQKQKLFLNNFQAGHLLDASGKRTIFSSQSFISRQWWAGNILITEMLCIKLNYTIGEEMRQYGK